MKMDCLDVLVCERAEMADEMVVLLTRTDCEGAKGWCGTRRRGQTKEQ